jgi:hypothetical protein
MLMLLLFDFPELLSFEAGIIESPCCAIMVPPSVGSSEDRGKYTP